MKLLKNTTFANIRVGKPEVRPDTPSHIKGVRQGNQLGSLAQEPGIIEVENNWAKGTARRSTGVSPEKRNPIHPEMPNLSPP